MAVRTISTRLAIEGEAQYRAALTSINSELKTLQSSLKLTESEYAGNANSMEALTAKGEALNRIHETQTQKVKDLQAALQNAQNAVTTYQQKGETLRSTLESNTKSLSQMSEASKAAGREWAEQTKIVSSAEAELKKLQKSSQDTSASQADLKTKIDAAKSKMAELEQQTSGTAKAAGTLMLENDKLNRELAENANYLDAAQRGTNDWQTKLNGAKVTLNDLDTEIQKNDKYLDEAAQSADGCAESIDEFGNETQDTAGSVDTLSQALAAAGIVATLKKIADALGECIEASMEFESAFAGVKKTVNATDEQLAELEIGIKNMAMHIPSTTTEIAAVTEAAGQLGIKAENILGFTEVMTNLGVATNLSANEAASALAKFANVVKMSPDSYEELGSVIVALGNNFATTEADIVSMATRLASTGAVVGLSESQIMAVATAVSSLGIEAEAGGSAISKLLKKIEVAAQTYNTANDYIRKTGMSLRELQMYADADGKAFKSLANELGLTSNELKKYMSNAQDMENFSRVAGMSAKEFQQAWGEDAVRALDIFITGLNEMDQSGESAVAVLEEMGITEVRLSNAVLSMASNGGILTEALDLANEAWKENNALTKEATQRYETTESRLQLLKNSFENVKVAVGDQLNPALGNLYDTGAEVLQFIADVIKECDWLVPVITAVITALGLFVIGLTTYTIVVKLAAAATAAFTACMETNPIFLITTAIVALIAAVGALVATLPDATTEFDELSSTSRLQYIELQQLNEEYERTCTVYGKTSKEAEALKKKIEGQTASYEANKESAEEIAAAHQAIIDKHNELKASYDELTAQNETQTATNGHLITRLQELITAEEKTTQTKWEILGVVDALNKALPDLGLAYNEVTESLNLSFDAIKKIAKAEAERVKQAADYQYLIDLYGEQATLLANVSKADTEAAAAQEVYNQALAAYNKAANDNQYLLSSGEMGALAYSMAMQNVTGTLESARIGQEEANQQIKDAKVAYDDNTVAIDECAKALTAIDEQTKNAADSVSQAADAANLAAESITLVLGDLAQSYLEAYDSARESLDGQIGLWEKLDPVVASSTESMQEAVDSQIEYLQGYQENMESLLSRNIEGVEKLAANFTDGSAESAAALAGLATATDTEIAAIISSMSQVDEYKDSLATIFATLDVDLQGSLSALSTNYANTIAEITGSTGNIDFTPFLTAVETAFGGIGVQFEQAGNDAGTGLATGIEASSSNAQTAATTMAQAVIDATRKALDSHSPSLVMTDIGTGIPEGMSNGIDAATPDLVAVIDGLCATIVTTMETAGTDAVNKFDTAYREITSRTQTVLDDLNLTISTSTSSLPGEMTTVGQSMIEGMIDGLNSQSSTLYSTISEIVNSAIASARLAADSHSPSRKTIKLFEDIDEGMIVGAKNKAADVAGALQNVVNQALDFDVSKIIPDVIADIDNAAPNLERLPRSTSADNRRYDGDTVIHLHMEGDLVVREEADIDKISAALYEKAVREKRRRGN